MPAVYRSTAAVEAVPGRAAILGANMTAQEVGVTVATTAPAPDKFAYVYARWVDVNNHLRALLHLDSTSDTISVILRIAGVDTVLQTSASPIIQPNALYRIRLIVFVSGRFIASFFGPGGDLHGQLEDRHTALATGGALASGKGGFGDVSIGFAPATRTYDQFYISTPPAEPVTINSGRTLELRHDGAKRLDAGGTYWGNLTYRGSPVFIPVAGTRGRKTRIAVIARRNDIVTASDDAITDSTIVELRYTPRYLIAPR